MAEPVMTINGRLVSVETVDAIRVAVRAVLVSLYTRDGRKALDVGGYRYRERLESATALLVADIDDCPLRSAVMSDADDSGRVWSVGDRGVWAPHGMTGSMVLAGVKVIREKFEEFGIPPYTDRELVCAIWLAVTEEKRATDLAALAALDGETL